MRTQLEGSDFGVSVRQAERDATKLLQSWLASEGPTHLPVDPFAVARSLGITVRFAKLPPDESGNVVIPSNGGAVITLNEYDAPVRQRFTCAHEIGHYRRRQAHPGLGKQTFIDYRDTLAGLGQDPEEIYANQFAAALLMPAAFVQRRFAVEGKTGQELASEFGTSVQAMNLRLRNLGLV